MFYDCVYDIRHIEEILNRLLLENHSAVILKNKNGQTFELQPGFEIVLTQKPGF